MKNDGYSKVNYVLWNYIDDEFCHGHYRNGFWLERLKLYFSKKSQQSHSVCVFESGDTEYLLRKDRLFANKFDCNNVNSQAALSIIEHARNDKKRIDQKSLMNLI